MNIHEICMPLTFHVKKDMEGWNEFVDMFNKKKF